MASSANSRRFQSRQLAACVAGLVAVLVGINKLPADDWPQINGPNRNGVAINETLLTQWPASGLREVWSHPVGQGNAGPVVVGDTLIVFHRPGKQYLVEALNAKTGKPIWKQELEADYTGGMDGDLGPKCVPLVHGDRVYLYGAGGNAYCLDVADGTVVWSKDVRQEFNSRLGFFGVGSTPIVVDGNLIVNAGGRNGSVVALDAETGKLNWMSFKDEASYSSPIEIKIDGQSVVVFVTRLNLIGLNPTTGKVLFETKFGKSGPTVNAAMPVNISVEGKQFLFVTAAYGVGARWLEVSKEGWETIWENDSSFSSQYSTPVYCEGNLFGTAGREDFKNGSYRCIDPTNGNVLWTQDDFPVGHSLLVGKQILVLDSAGGFHVIEASPAGFKRTYQTQLFDSESRAMPAISGGLFYARSNANRGGEGKLVCVEVGIQHK